MTTATIAARVDVISLFGSHGLIRDGETNAWIFVTASTEPEVLTDRESMFINAALNAGRRFAWAS